MSHKRGSKTITGEDELEVDVINILSDNGLEIKDYAGTNGEVIQKSAVTNELIWGIVPPPGANTITSAMLQENSVDNRALGTDAVETINIKDLNITTAKIAADAVTTTQLATNSVTAGIIADNTIVDGNIAVNSIGGDKIGNREITGAKISVGGILVDNLASNAATTVKINNLAVTTAKIADDAVTIDKLANGSITAANLTAGFSIDSFGTIQLTRPDDDAPVFKANYAFGGKDAGEGSLIIGSSSQIGLLIDEPPGTGTAIKGLIFASAYEAIIPANSGTGWLPLQVKTYSGAAGDKFKVDLDGNTTCALKLSCNNLGVDGDTATITSSGIITGTKINGPQFNLSANSGTVNFHNFSGTTIAGSSHSTKTTATNLKFDSNTNKFNKIDFDNDDFNTYIKGCNYATKETVGTHLNLSSTTNKFDGKYYGLPERIYYDTVQAKYYYSFNGADFRPNDDSAFYGISIVDSSASLRGFAKSTHSSMEMVAIFQIPDGWTATDVKVNNYSSALNLNCYKVFNDGTTSSHDLFADPSDGAGSTRQTNTEQALGTNFPANRNEAIMIVVHTTSSAQYVAGGYIEVTYPVSGG